MLGKSVAFVETVRSDVNVSVDVAGPVVMLVVVDSVVDVLDEVLVGSCVVVIEVAVSDVPGEVLAAVVDVADSDMKFKTGSTSQCHSYHMKHKSAVDSKLLLYRQLSLVISAACSVLSFRYCKANSPKWSRCDRGPAYT